MDLCVHSVGTDVVSVRVGKLLADGHKVRPYGAVRSVNLAEQLLYRDGKSGGNRLIYRQLAPFWQKKE